jgi:type IV secretion system protein VirB4
VTKLSRIFKDYREAGSLDSLVNIHAAINEHTFLTKSGEVLTVLQADPSDYECLEPSQLDHVARRFEGALRHFDETFRIYQYLLKRSEPELTSSRCDHPLLQRLSAARDAFLERRASGLYSLETNFVVVYSGWQPSPTWRSRLTEVIDTRGAALRSAFSTGARTEQLDEALSRACRVLSEKVNSVVLQLQDVLPLRILDRQQAFRLFRRLLNYSPAKADAGRLSDNAFIGFQAADSALECYRDHLRLDDYAIQVLSLKEPPAHTFPHLWRDLLEIPASFVAVTEWQRVDNARARRLIQSKRRHFHNSKTSLMNYVGSSASTGPHDPLIDTSAVALVGDLGRCLEELEVAGKFLGRFSMTLALYDRDRAAVQRAAAACFKVFAAHDARVIEERYNLLNAWLSILPGNDAYNLRRLWLLSANYADLSFLLGQRIGERINRHLGREALAVLETESRTPYFLNLHHEDVAHAVVLGATGSGKSFLLNFLLTSLQKYEPRTFIFDLGGSYERLTRAFKGAYAAIGSPDRCFAINPFCLPPTPENLQFLASFCRVLIESGGYAMTAADERDLAEQIENVYAVEADQRRLLTLANVVNRTMRQYLHKWVGSGSHARWFDNVTDTITFETFHTFEFEGLDKYPDVLQPLLFYVLHRANAAIYDPALAATFKVFVLDEAWRFFRHPAIKLYIVEALKTWRKKNAALILATQSVDDLRQSELLPVVVESCATKLFLANPGMDRNVYREIFQLNEVEADRIAQLIPKKQLLFKRPDVAKVLTLNVDPEMYELFAGRASDPSAVSAPPAQVMENALKTLSGLPAGSPEGNGGIHA